MASAFTAAGHSAVVTLNHPSRKSTCKGPHCNGDAIEKGEIRFEIGVFGQRGRQTSFSCARCVVSNLILESAKTARAKCKQTGEAFAKGELKFGFRGHSGPALDDGTFAHGPPTWTKVGVATSQLLAPVLQTGVTVDPKQIAGFESLPASEQAAVTKALEVASVTAAGAGAIPEAFPGPCRCKGCGERAAAKKRKSGGGDGEAATATSAGSGTPPPKTKKLKTLKREVSAGVLPMPVLSHAVPHGGSTFDLVSWNVDGIRAAGRVDALRKLVKVYAPDLLCIQETKLQEKDEAEWVVLLRDEGYSGVFSSSSERKGYAGTAVFIKTDGSLAPVGDPTFGIGIAKKDGIDFDGEGRTITVEYPSFFVVNCYVPNSGQQLDRLSARVEHWDGNFRSYLKQLEKSKPVILTGDLNCAHLDADNYCYFKPHVTKVPGCTPVERESFGDFFSADVGFKDAFRELHGDVENAFTYFNQRIPRLRLQNKGLRLDYFICSPTLFGDRKERIHFVDHFKHDDPQLCPIESSEPGIPPRDRLPSDHVPIALQLAL